MENDGWVRFTHTGCALNGMSCHVILDKPTEHSMDAAMTCAINGFSVTFRK